jgi:putative transposase
MRRCKRVQGVGEIRIKLHRPISGKLKTVSVKREGQQWYACFSVEYEPKPLPALGNAIGIDVGLESFAALSNGKYIPNPRWYSKAKAKLRRAQRKVARRKKGSHRRRKAVALLEKSTRANLAFAK